MMLPPSMWMPHSRDTSGSSRLWRARAVLYTVFAFVMMGELLYFFFDFRREFHEWEWLFLVPAVLFGVLGIGMTRETIRDWYDL